MLWRLVQTRLEFSAKSLKTQVGVVGCNVSQRVAAIVIGCPLLRDWAIVGVIQS